MYKRQAIELYDEIIENFPNINLIASGGISSIEELKQLESIGVEGAIIGKAIYEGLIDLDELIQAFK